MLDPQRDENGKPKTSDGHFKPINLPEMKKFHKKELDLSKTTKAKEENDNISANNNPYFQQENIIKNIHNQKHNKTNRSSELSFSQALAQAKSAAYNHHSIADIEAKTARVMNMIAKTGAEMPDKTPNQDVSSSSNISNNSQSITNVSMDYLTGLRRDYQQMPSWRANIA
jgi:hypothetical protein